MINCGTHRGRPIARTHEPQSERSASPEFTTKVLGAVDVQLVPTTSRDCCLWKILLLIFVVVGLIVLDMDSHSLT